MEDHLSFLCDAHDADPAVRGGWCVRNQPFRFEQLEISIERRRINARLLCEGADRQAATV